MRKSLNRIASIATSVAMVGSMLLTASPVHAAAATVISDTLTREMIGVPADHVLKFTAGAWAGGTDMTVTFTSFGASGSDQTPTVTNVGGAGVTALLPTASNVLTLTCTTGPCGGGTYTVAAFTLTNPGSANSYSPLIAGDSALTGSYSIPIVDSDQVTISASVAVATTFDIDTGLAGDTVVSNAGVDTASPYSVDLGIIPLGAVRASGTTNTVNYIDLDLTSNATGGTLITVRSENGVLGLRSLSVPGDNIPSASGLMAAGTANYGICSIGTTVAAGPLSGSLNAVAPFAGGAGVCVGNGHTNTVGGLTTSPQTIYNTTSVGSDAITAGRATISVSAAIDTTTASHNDYQDLLTFIATGTF